MLYYYEESQKEQYSFVYTGNIGDKRWKSLSLLSNKIVTNNLGNLHIYTKTPLTKKMKRSLDNAILHGPISASEVIYVQNSADILVHVEPFGLKYKLANKYAISTKVMDYLGCGRCIIAVGPKGIASMNILEESNAAILIYNKTMLDELKEISSRVFLKSQNAVAFSRELMSSSDCDLNKI